MSMYNEYWYQLSLYGLLSEMATQNTEVMDVEAEEVTEDEYGITDNHTLHVVARCWVEHSCGDPNKADGEAR